MSKHELKYITCLYSLLLLPTENQPLHCPLSHSDTELPLWHPQGCWALCHPVQSTKSYGPRKLPTHISQPGSELSVWAPAERSRHPYQCPRPSHLGRAWISCTGDCACWETWTSKLGLILHWRFHDMTPQGLISAKNGLKPLVEKNRVKNYLYTLQYCHPSATFRGMQAWSSSRSFRQISRWSSPAPATMCSPDSSMIH